jgi:TolB protein
MMTIACAATAEPTHEIAFTGFAPLDTDLFIADADGSNAKAFLSHPDLYSNASFSRDGRWIVFITLRVLTDDQFEDGTPTWLR